MGSPDHTTPQHAETNASCHCLNWLSGKVAIAGKLEGSDEEVKRGGDSEGGQGTRGGGVHTTGDGQWRMLQPKGLEIEQGG